MALKRKIVGIIWKPKKEGSPPILKVKENVTLVPGKVYRVESKNFRLKQLEDLHTSGKIKDDFYNELKEKAKMMSDKILGELILLEDK
jgi:hypothetical protein